MSQVVPQLSLEMKLWFLEFRFPITTNYSYFRPSLNTFCFKYVSLLGKGQISPHQQLSFMWTFGSTLWQDQLWWNFSEIFISICLCKGGRLLPLFWPWERFALILKKGKGFASLLILQPFFNFVKKIQIS